jgi:hypothetical protein
MKKRCKTKPYFDGGQLAGLGQYSQALTGNINNAKTSAELMNSGKLSQGQKAAMMLGNLGGGVIGGQITNQLISNSIEDPFQDSQALQQRNQMFGLENGGMLNYYNGGFKHSDPSQDNQFNGIPQGMTPEGNLNTVEKDETRYQDFVFSGTLKVDKNIAKEFNLPKSSVGKTFAQVSKTMDKELIERPNDKFTKATVERNMQNLMMANNTVKEVDENMLAKGGPLDFDPYQNWFDQGAMFANLPNPERQNTLDEKYNTAQGTNPFLVNNFAKINNDPYNRENVTYPSVQGMPPFGATAPTGPRGKRWTVNDVLKYATTPEDKTAALTNFGRRPAGEWGYYANLDGQEIGEDNVPVQDIDGRFAGGVTPEHLSILYPNIAKQVSPDGSLNWNEEQIDKFQELYKKANYNQLNELSPANPTYGKIGGDYLRGTDIPGEIIPPPNELLKPLPKRSDKVKKSFDAKLMPAPNKQPTVEEPGTPPTNIKVPNLWPEAGMLSALPYAGLKPVLADPTTMSTGYLKPQLVDEMSMRSGIDVANRANVGALANVTGGSAAAQRAGLMGAGSNYMDATGNAFLQANQANNQARMAADQFNIQNQTGVAGQNMGALNQFELENKELINNINAKKADEFANTWSNYVENASKRRSTRELEDARRRDIKAFTGYDVGETGTFMNITPGTPGIPKHQLTWEEWSNSKDPNKLAKNTTFNMGGALRTIRRSLK